MRQYNGIKQQVPNALLMFAWRFLRLFSKTPWWPRANSKLPSLAQ